jgi:uncharacterized membrane protein YhiD involved in acid resistance
VATKPQQGFWRDRPSKRQLTAAAGYVTAAAVYIAIGVAYTDFLFSFFVALAYLLLVAWLVPAAVRRVF